jgi:hypothetical protein
MLIEMWEWVRGFDKGALQAGEILQGMKRGMGSTRASLAFAKAARPIDVAKS